ncbi:hypothetical protein SUGI_1373870 [Cryptomeria japonica]|uniref:Uncharacterized protein n=1 Tax=Cryptomeria japonica TaxID=3369 RepID=A0AAD3NRZ5_CRYJA|nr:hypothetical protein SUGI_1373870 [Cryptomeria japonica]
MIGLRLSHIIGWLPRRFNYERSGGHDLATNRPGLVDRNAGNAGEGLDPIEPDRDSGSSSGSLAFDLSPPSLTRGAVRLRHNK